MVNPAFDRSWIKNAWSFQEPAAQPIVTLGYQDRIPPLQTGVPGLVLANTTQVYPEDRGTNYAVRIGNDAAAALHGLVRVLLTDRYPELSETFVEAEVPLFDVVEGVNGLDGVDGGASARRWLGWQLGTRSACCGIVAVGGAGAGRRTSRRCASSRRRRGAGATRSTSTSTSRPARP